ncbi:MAG: type II toxin-antitoxin system RelE family toxin [Dehalococcoidia bacterium]
MASRVVWSQAAIQQLMAITRAEPRTAKRVSDAIFDYAREGRGNVKRLQGEPNSWPLRVGNLRVIFALSTDLMDITSIDDRKDAYR